GIHRAQGFALATPGPLPIGAPAYQPLDLDALLEGPDTPGTAPPDDPAAAISVTAHSLLSAVGAIESALTLLRQRSDRIDLTDSSALLITAERQAHHVGHVLHNLVKGMPTSADQTASPDRLQL